MAASAPMAAYQHGALLAQVELDEIVISQLGGELQGQQAVHVDLGHAPDGGALRNVCATGEEGRRKRRAAGISRVVVVRRRDADGSRYLRGGALAAPW